MAGLRKGHCYTTIERPYTRHSKFKSKGYIATVPESKIVLFNMGDSTKKFEYEVKLISNDAAQIRHNALESTRILVNRHLQGSLGNEYYFMVNAYPHHILRENKMLGGAHADRLQTGMAHSFGKPISLAAQVKRGKVLMTAKVNANGLEVAKEALKKARPRLPITWKIEITKII